MEDFSGVRFYLIYKYKIDYKVLLKFQMEVSSIACNYSSVLSCRRSCSVNCRFWQSFLRITRTEQFALSLPRNGR